MVILIGKTRTFIFKTFLVNTFFYLSNNLFYEVNEQFLILRKLSNNSFTNVKTQNLEDTFKRRGLYKYNHKSGLNIHLGTCRKFYPSFRSVRLCNTTSVVSNHEFLTSFDLKTLKTLCKIRKKDRKIVDLITLLQKPDILKISYKILISKFDKIKFSIFKITLENIKYQWFENLSIRLRNGSFKYISIENYKKNNFSNFKLLKLGNLRNEIVNQAIEILLEFIYEPVFLDTSHGFRPYKGCHAAIKQIKLNWTETSWFLSYDIQQCISNLDCNRLINVLSNKISDKQFLALILKFLKINFKNNKTQNNKILAPMLYNIYLHSLDLEIVKIQTKFEDHKKKRLSRKHLNLTKFKTTNYRTLDVLKYGSILSHKGHVVKRKLNYKSEKNKYNSNVIRYVRYLNFFLLGIHGSSKLINKIDKRITTFCNSNLKLLITNKKSIYLPSETVKFLNFEIGFRCLDRLSKKYGKSLEKFRKIKNKLKILKDLKALKKKKLILATFRKILKEKPHKSSKIRVKKNLNLIKFTNFQNEILGKQQFLFLTKLVKLIIKKKMFNLKEFQIKIFKLYTSISNLNKNFKEEITKYNAKNLKSGKTKRKNSIIIKVSLKDLKRKLIGEGFISKSNKPKAINWLISYSNYLIVKWFHAMAKNLLNSYCCCQNFYKVKIYVDYMVRYSALYTLATKNKLTINETIKRWSRDIIIRDKKNKVILTQFLTKAYIKRIKKTFIQNINLDNF